MPDGPSRFAYVNNSPLMYVDPEGLFWQSIAWGIAKEGAKKAAQYGAKKAKDLYNFCRQKLFPKAKPINPKDTKTWPEPPGKKPHREGLPSRKKPRERGEKSLWDADGGEWRPHTPDKYHDDWHWDYKGPGKGTPWKNIPPE